MKPIFLLIAASMLVGAQDVRVQPSNPGAARRPGTPTGPTPKLADGSVDLSGVWRPDINFIEDIALGLKPGEKVPLLPAAEKLMKTRQSKEDPDPTWYGHSVGRWDGDSLVIDSVGFNDRFWFDFTGHPHTEKLHTIERFTRKDLGTLVDEVTIDDPGAYSMPFTITSSNRLVPGEEIMEYICQENERDSHHLVGPAGRP